MLKTAFVQGRLTKDELESRAGQAFISRTYSELTAVTADLPVELIASPPPRRSAPDRPEVNASPSPVAILIATVAMLTAFLWAAAILTQNNGAIEVTFLTTLADCSLIPMVAFVTAAQAIDARQRNRSGTAGPPPPPPPPPAPAPAPAPRSSSRSPGSRNSRRLDPAGPGQLPGQLRDDLWGTAEDTATPTATPTLPSARAYHWGTAGADRIRNAIIMIATRSA